MPGYISVVCCFVHSVHFAWGALMHGGHEGVLLALCRGEMLGSIKQGQQYVACAGAENGRWHTYATLIICPWAEREGGEQSLMCVVCFTVQTCEQTRARLATQGSWQPRQAPFLFPLSQSALAMTAASFSFMQPCRLSVAIFSHGIVILLWCPGRAHSMSPY